MYLSILNSYTNIYKFEYSIQSEFENGVEKIGWGIFRTKKYLSILNSYTNIYKFEYSIQSEFENCVEKSGIIM